MTSVDYRQVDASLGTLKMFVQLLMNSQQP